MPPPDELLDSIALMGLGRMPRRSPATLQAAPLTLVYSRDITFADIEVLRTIPLEMETPSVGNLRATHHALARVLASGANYLEAAATTGHAPGRVAFLASQDRGFIELVEHYKGLATEQFVDMQGRLATLGAATVEELQERLEEHPETFSHKELRELASMTLDRSVAPAKGAGRNGPNGSSAPVSVSVTFVSPKAPEAGTQIESTITEAAE